MNKKIKKVQGSPTKVDTNQQHTTKPDGESSHGFSLAPPYNSKEELGIAIKLLVLEQFGVANFNSHRNLIPTREGRTITEATLDSSIASGKRLLARFQEELGILDQIPTPQQEVLLPIWTKDLLKSVPYKTWYNIRKQVLRILRYHLTLTQEKAREFLYSSVVDKALEENKKKANTLYPPDLSQNRPFIVDGFGNVKQARFIDYHNFNLMIKFLREEIKSEYGELAANMFVAGVATGLRPNEWTCTILIDDDNLIPSDSKVCILSLLNAKSSNGPVNQAARNLDLSDLWAPDLDAVTVMVEQGRFWRETGTFKNDYIKIKKVMKTVNLAIQLAEGYFVSMYTARHQCKNNIEIITSPEEVSAILGHKTLGTAKYDYGAKDRAWLPEEMSAIPRSYSYEINAVLDNEKANRIKRKKQI